MNIALKHLDQVIIDALQAWKEADARYDIVGREHAPEDKAELGAAHSAEEAAKDILCETVPQTMAGVLALLELAATDKSPWPGDASAIAANLLASPVLAIH